MLVKPICAVTGTDEQTFTKGYRYCRITRSLQILGAFGYLSVEKKKLAFDDYIPAAVASLQRATQYKRRTQLSKTEGIG